MDQTLKLTKLKCKTCGVHCNADDETVTLTIDTCVNKNRTDHMECGISKIKKTLRSINNAIERKVKTKLIDPDLQAAYPHKNCQMCGLNVANAYECRSLIMQHACPLTKIEPASCRLLEQPKSHPVRHIRDVIKEAKERQGNMAVTNVSKETGEFEYEVPDPIYVFIDKKGKHHIRAIL